MGVRLVRNVSVGTFVDVAPPAAQSQEGRRSPIDMACDILRVLSEGQAKPTQILQRANMNWTVLSSNLTYLYGQGMVERVGKHGTRTEYRLTIKGQSILQLYEELKLSLRGVANIHPTAENQGSHKERHNGSSKGLNWSLGKTWTLSTVLS